MIITGAAREAEKRIVAGEWTKIQLLSYHWYFPAESWVNLLAPFR
jgi:hypothetical protein